MRIVIAVAILAGVAACTQGALTQSLTAYKACIDAKGAKDCENERLKFEADKAYADSVSRRSAARGPLVLASPAPASREVNCTTIGATTTCR